MCNATYTENKLLTIFWRGSVTSRVYYLGGNDMIGFLNRKKKAAATAITPIADSCLVRIDQQENDKPKPTPTPIVCLSEVQNGMQIPNDWPEWLAVVVSSGIWPWAQTNLQIGDAVLLRYDRVRFRNEWEVPYICASPFVYVNLYIQKVLCGWNVWSNGKITGMIRKDVAYGKGSKPQRFILIMGAEAEGLNVVEKFSLFSLN